MKSRSRKCNTLSVKTSQCHVKYEKTILQKYIGSIIYTSTASETQ